MFFYFLQSKKILDTTIVCKKSEIETYLFWIRSQFGHLRFLHLTLYPWAERLRSSNSMWKLGTISSWGNVETWGGSYSFHTPDAAMDDMVIHTDRSSDYETHRAAWSRNDTNVPFARPAQPNESVQLSHYSRSSSAVRQKWFDVVIVELVADNRYTRTWICAGWVQPFVSKFMPWEFRKKRT